MAYVLHGRLYGYICRDCPRPLSGVIVRAYAPVQDDSLVARAVADARFTAAAIDEDSVAARAKRLLAEATVGEDGRFEIAFDRKSGYAGGPVEIDLRVEGLAQIEKRTAEMAPRQIQLTTLQPSWRQRGNGLIAGWEYYLPSGLWCRILSWYDIWVICGRVLVEATGASAGGVVVKAFDRDWLQDDALGSAVTDGAGRFQIYYSGADFRETIFSPAINLEWTGGPDLYFIVETANGTPLLVEPPERAREPDRENVPNCFCVTLLLKKQQPPGSREPIAAFTQVGDYTFAQIASVPGPASTGLTGDNRAFYGVNRLNGVLSKTLGGVAMEYMFEYRTTDDHGGSPGSWLPVTQDMIAPTEIGKWEIFKPDFVGDPNPVKTKPYVVNGTAPGHKVVTFNGNWIQVPQQSDAYDETVGYFTPNNDLIRLISSSLATFIPVNMSGKAAGDSAAPLAANKHFALRMRVRQLGDPGTETDGGLLQHYAVNNTTYNNIVQHPYWAGGPLPNGMLGVSMLGIAELKEHGCKKITDTLTVQVTAAHPTLGSVTLSLVGGNATTVAPVAPGGPLGAAAVLTPPIAGLPGQRFGNATLNFDAADLTSCAYILTLDTTLLLTDGDEGPGVLRDQIAFAK